MNIVSIIMLLCEQLASDLIRVGNTWVKYLFGKSSDVIAFIEDNSIKVISIIAKQTIIMNTDFHVMVLDPIKGWISQKVDIQTKYTPFIVKRKGGKRMGSINETSWVGPQRYCIYCGTQLELTTNQDVWSCSTCGELRTEGEFSYHPIANRIVACTRRENNEPLTQEDKWELHYLRHDLRSTISKRRAKRMKSSSRNKAMDWLNSHEEEFDRILRENNDDRGRMMDNGMRVDCCEYREPTHVDCNMNSGDEGYVAPDEGTDTTERRMPSKGLTENKSLYSLEQKVLEYFRGEMDLDTLELRIYSTFTNGYISLEDYVYFRHIVGLPTPDDNPDPDPDPKPKYRSIKKPRPPKIEKVIFEPSTVRKGFVYVKASVKWNGKLIEMSKVLQSCNRTIHPLWLNSIMKEEEIDTLFMSMLGEYKNIHPECVLQYRTAKEAATEKYDF